MNRLLKCLRSQIGRGIPEAQETARAEADLMALSFQSTVYPERHVWIYTYGEAEINIDLEDWNTDDEWDNAIARKTASSIKEAVEIIQNWVVVEFPDT